MSTCAFADVRVPTLPIVVRLIETIGGALLMTHPSTAARPFRWQTAEGLRHATGDPLPTPTDDDEEEMPIMTLCGAEVIPQPADFGDPGSRWPIPTCWDCEAAWRKHEGIPDPPSRDVEAAR